jgi:hypothetical protein
MHSQISTWPVITVQLLLQFICPKQEIFKMFTFSNICIVFAIIASCANAQIALGECKTFAIHAGTKVAFNGELSTVNTGSVGMSPGTSVSGNFAVKDGTIQINSIPANKCADDRTTAYNAGNIFYCLLVALFKNPKM